jgi:uncharacterized protein
MGNLKNLKKNNIFITHQNIRSENISSRDVFAIRHVYIIIFLAFIFSACTTQKQPTNTPTTPYPANELIQESSPYLLQHAHNPVNWHAWNDKSLEKAKNTRQLMVISIGYAACHWCHVMEHESFEDTSVANIMNKHFLNIKIDREERPDIDNIYMSACQLTNENGCGWPLNVIALPDGKPVWVGTYLSKKDWLTTLDFFVKAQQNEPEKLTAYAAQLAQGIQNTNLIAANQKPIAFQKGDLPFIVANILQKIDTIHGGKNGAPKFPLAGIYEFLLHYYHIEGDEKSLKAVTTTLDKMADGGIYDHLRGGFARYSTDREWKVPHFEKMLYDNAQLISLYSHAWQVTKKPLYEKIVHETMDFIEKESATKEGAFYASFDADSNGEEGAFYTWKKEEIEAILIKNLGENTKIFHDFYEITAVGNWENGRNILHRRQSLQAIAQKYKLTESEIATIITTGKRDLLAARRQRISPKIDDKILTSWNALMLKGCTAAYRAFGMPKYLEMARKNAQFLIKKQMQPDGRLYRNYKNGKSSVNGFLEDYAQTITAFIALYEVTFEEEWLRYAEKMADYALQHFLDRHTGLCYFTSDLDSPLIARKIEVTDDVLPSANSAFALALQDLGTRLGKQIYSDRAAKMMQVMYKTTISEGYSIYYYNWCKLFIPTVQPPFEIVIIGKEAVQQRDSLLRKYLPNSLILGGKTEGSLPLLKDKLQKNETYIYVCQNKTCKLPVKTIQEVLPLLRKNQ